MDDLHFAHDKLLVLFIVLVQVSSGKEQTLSEDELEAIKLQVKEINGHSSYKEEAYFIWAELIVSINHAHAENFNQ